MTIYLKKRTIICDNPKKRTIICDNLKKRAIMFDNLKKRAIIYDNPSVSVRSFRPLYPEDFQG